MKTLGKKSTCLFLAVLLALLMGALCACGELQQKEEPQEDIAILFTGCSDCAVTKTDKTGKENVGFAGVAAYKKAMLKKTSNVSVVDCGDAISGGIIGSISKGSYIVDIMNKVGYDVCALGNYEFAYGIPNLQSLIYQSKAKYVAANITYTGSSTNKLSVVKPYYIKKYGNRKVAYVGVTTPKTPASTTPGNFMENGVFVYDFAGGRNGQDLYVAVQSAIDAAKKAGADYVVAVTHLGWGDDDAGVYGADKVAANTTGLDAILDGNSREEVADKKEKNKDGKDVLIASAGRELEKVGCLTIKTDGTLKAEIAEPAQKDAATKTYIAEILEENEEYLSTEVAMADGTLYAMTVESSASGDTTLWHVREQEMAIGNLCADAFRAIGEADIAFVNGGGIRANIQQGLVTYRDILNVQPYGNMLCVAAVSGQQILDVLEIGAMYVGTRVFGGFQQVSGIRFTIDATIPSPATIDPENEKLKVIGEGERRVRDVWVENPDGSYSEIDPEKMYTLASTDYLIKNSGDGIPTLAGCGILIEDSIPDYQVLIDYVTETLDGKISYRGDASGRITILLPEPAEEEGEE